MTPRPLGEKLTKDLDPKAIDEVWDRIEARRAKARPGPRFFVLAAALAVALFFVVRAVRAPIEPVAIRLASGELLPPALEPVRDHDPSSHDIVLDDASRLSLAPGTRLVPVVNTGRALAFTMAPGKATFDVTPNGPRTWTIEAGLATVTVLGTKFVVLREEHRVRVDVERGHVRVAGVRVPNGSIDLLAGQWVEIEDGAVLPPLAPSVAPSSTAPATSPSSSAAPSSTLALAAHPLAPVEPEWHPLAKKGDYGAAYEALGKEGVARETKRATAASQLMQVADVARLSGHPADAVAPLERVLVEHGGDPSAPQAAFTLGKIQLDALGNARAGAAAFERAIALGLPGALREDAFFRRVEAYARAGDAAGARTARAAYDSAFPEGRYRTKVAALAP